MKTYTLPNGETVEVSDVTAAMVEEQLKRFPQPAETRETQSHMNADLLNLPEAPKSAYPWIKTGEKMGDAPSQGFTTKGETLAPGLSQQRYDEMMNEFHRSYPKLLSEGEKLALIVKACIKESFNTGTGR